MEVREAYVVDACVFVDHLLGRRALIGDSIEMHTPSAADLEIMSAWRRMILAGTVGASTVREAVELYSAMAIRRHEHILLLPRIWQLRHDITAFDAAYVALAEALGMPLLTADRKLARTARRYCEVIAV
ncbi:MAG: type II toxin-antitoxin system VapC family toxin [Protaetiibacter sp.]